MTQPLKFGKFKGLTFEQTPKWYQDWLINQEWFIPTSKSTVNLYKVYNLNGILLDINDVIYFVVADSVVDAINILKKVGYEADEDQIELVRSNLTNDSNEPVRKRIEYCY